MDLLIVQLKTAIRRLLNNKGVRARVLDKVNRYGEVVIGVILERPPPPLRVLDASSPIPPAGEPRAQHEQDAREREERREKERPADADGLAGPAAPHAPR